MNQDYAELLAGDLATFVGKTLGTINPGVAYLPNWHVDVICEYLNAIERGEIQRLIINMPPRALKSTCVSVAWPAWLLGHNAARRVMVASYAQSLSLNQSLDTRAVMQAEWYKKLFPDIHLLRDQNEKSKFMTGQRGFRMSTSVGANAIGEGGNFLIVDDPQTPAQALSPSGREATNQWFDYSFSTRLDDKHKGAIVVVMQRLHEEDLSGYLLKKGGWEHLCLPAVADAKKTYSVGAYEYARKAKEVLHADRENETLIARAKLELGSQAFAAQYQQNPLPQEGGMVRPWWLGRYSNAPLEPTKIVQSWDTAIKAGAAHDASVCLTFAQHEGAHYLLDATVVRLEYPDLKRLVVAQAQRYSPHAILMEDKASGQQLLQDLKREGSLPLIAVMPKGDKVTRFAAISAMIEAGRVLLPKHASWLTDFEAELFAFPAAAHDDQVDAVTQYLDWVRKGIGDGMRIRKL